MSGAPSKYDPTYCAAIIEHCSDGSSITSFAAKIDVCRDTITEWSKVHAEFSLAVKIAKAKACAWWEKTARTTAVSGSGNATLCIFGMKNMGGEDWRDKQELEHGASPDVLTAITRRIVQPEGGDPTSRGGGNG